MSGLSATFSQDGTARTLFQVYLTTNARLVDPGLIKSDPTELFYQIVERFSPHVIANIFFGHTHEDEVMIYYANNGTMRNNNSALAQPLAPGWIGPSVTPLTNLNSGFRMYEVDTGSFDIYEAYTFYSNVSAWPSLNVSSTGPTYNFEYSTRQAYGNASGWPATAPLNATFW